MAVDGIGNDLGILTAASDLSGKQFRGVIVAGSKTADVGGAGANALGVLQNKPLAGQAASIRVEGLSKVVAGGTIAAGADIALDATGAFVTATTGAFIIGKALEAAVSGQVFSGMIVRGGKA